MKLTRKKAIELSIELWEWLAETGEGKGDWPQWKDNGGKYCLSRTMNICPLCEYRMYQWPTNRHCSDVCPYAIRHKHLCDGMGTPYSKWDAALTVQAKKKYAKQFLKQLKALLEEVK